MERLTRRAREKGQGRTFSLRLSPFAFRLGVHALFLLILGCYLAQADGIEPEAKKVLERTLSLYTGAKSFSSVTTFTSHIPFKDAKTSTMDTVLRYEYQFMRPAKLVLTYTESLSLKPEESGKTIQVVSDGEYLQGKGKKYQIAHTPTVLLDYLYSLGVVPVYDLVFLLGGQKATGEFMKKIVSLKIVREEGEEKEKRVILQGTMRDESQKLMEVEMAIGVEDGLLKMLRLSRTIRYEGHETQNVLSIEFKPILNPVIEEKVFQIQP